MAAEQRPRPAVRGSIYVDRGEARHVPVLQVIQRSPEHDRRHIPVAVDERETRGWLSRQQCPGKADNRRNAGPGGDGEIAAGGGGARRSNRTGLQAPWHPRMWHLSFRFSWAHSENRPLGNAFDGDLYHGIPIGGGADRIAALLGGAVDLSPQRQVLPRCVKARCRAHARRRRSGRQRSRAGLL